MSKAFTRESDETAVEEIASSRQQLPPGVTNYITRDGANRLKQRLNALLETKRAAAAISNNAAPLSDADRQKIESSIRKVQQILDSVVIAEIPADREKVAFGATVKVRHGSGEEVYQIVGVEETNPESGRISWISPMARALFSRKAGEKVRFRSPAGDEELAILAVTY